MRVLAINGSPRRKNNTAILLDHALKGAASLGAETQLIHLQDYNFKGCVSCFACKRKDGAAYGTCGYKDALSPVLNMAAEADVLILGSPIYLRMVTGGMRCFFERLIFPYLVYDVKQSTLATPKSTAFIYNMNVDTETMQASKCDEGLWTIEMYMNRIFGNFGGLFVNDTYQFDDYSKYVAPIFDEPHKAEIKNNQFPLDCQNAFDLGARLVMQAK